MTRNAVLAFVFLSLSIYLLIKYGLTILSAGSIVVFITFCFLAAIEVDGGGQ